MRRLGLTCAYIKALNGSVAVFFFGVVDIGTLLFQQHLDAVNRPGSDACRRERKEERRNEDAGSSNTPAFCMCSSKPPQIPHLLKSWCSVA